MERWKIMISDQKQISEKSLNEIKGLLWNIESFYNYELPAHFVTIFQQVNTVLEVKMLIIALEGIEKKYSIVKKLIDLCLNELEKITELPKELLKDKMKSAKKGDLIKLDNIYFFNNSAKSIPTSEPILYELLCIMNDNPKLVIEIQGHICCKSPNQKEGVSTARARAVYNYLIRNKIKRERMSFKGYGVTRPVHPIPEKTTQEEDENRRVEILIISILSFLQVSISFLDIVFLFIVPPLAK